MLDPARHSGPALRTFANIARLWQLSAAEQLALLGQPKASTFADWISAARQHRDVALPVDVLMRLGVVFRIHKSFATYSGGAMPIACWLRLPRAELPFTNKTPVDLMMAGDNGLLQTCRYLDAACSGLWLDAADRVATSIPDRFSGDDIEFE